MIEAAMALLSAALDPSGYIAVVGLKNGHPAIQTFYAPGNYTSACTQALHLSERGYDAYYATSTLKNNNSRKAENANAVKVFKLDLDVAPDDDRKYPSQSAAVAAIVEFCDANGLPHPVFVNSGWGVHCYWILTEALDQDDGKLYAEKFKAACLARQLKIDPTVTGDIARILRVPGTVNFKVEGKPKRVKLAGDITLVDTDAMLDHVDRLYGSAEVPKLVKASLPGMMDGMVIPEHLRGQELDKMTRGLLEGKPKKFTVLLRRSIEEGGKGCAQIKKINDEQSSIEEPRWRSGLSIAKFCEDGPEAIHMISRYHPGYSPDGTEAKADLIPAPHTCKHFATNWPKECEKCPHLNKITSPIQLGDYVPRAPKGDNVVLAQNKAVQDAPEPYVIPEYPFPYFRAANGGVWRSSSGGSGEDGDDDAEQICKLDFYMVNRLKSDMDGYIAQLRVHHVKDGVVDFTMNTTDFSIDKLRDGLYKQGILLHGKELAHMQSYVTRWFETLSAREEVAMVKTQFGWTDGFKSFVIGDREIFPGHSTKYSPAAPSLAGVTKLFSKKGDAHEWYKAFNVYAQPGFEAHAFCVLVGFGSPLLALTPLKGVLINAFSQDSGTGKSTLLKAASSIWGDPQGLMLNWKDSFLARLHRMGVHQHIPICVDEVTKMSEEDMSDTLLSATAGRGRNRMSSSANMERINNTTWAAITLTSANTSFSEKLQAEKAGVEGELMRLLEPHIKPTTILTKIQADRIFGTLDENFGHAGETYIKHVLDNMERVKRMMATEQQALDRDAELTSKERYWSAAFACILVGGILAKECGLHDIDMDAIRNYMMELVGQMRARLNFTSQKENKHDLLGEFLSAHSMNILSVKVDDDKHLVTVLRECQSQSLLVRWEQNHSKAYVMQSAMRKYCKDRNVHLDDYLKEQEAAGVFEGATTKRLATGTALPSAPARVYIFKISDGLKDLDLNGEQK